MSQELISRSADLKRLRDEGLNIEINDGYLLVHDVPYLNSSRNIKRGVLVSAIDINAEGTIKPKKHVIYFSGDYPCNKEGTQIEGIRHKSEKKTLASGVDVDHSFSNKPQAGYRDYHEKITTYIKIISGPAKSLDSDITEKTFQVIEDQEDKSVFRYIDSNSSRAEIVSVSDKLKGQKVAIVGLGGTGAYVLDLVSKAPVEEIHLYDGDNFLQHNTFRSPGAATIEELANHVKKTQYFSAVYSAMHKNVIAHEAFVTEENVDLLTGMDFVFLCMDANAHKATIVSKLVETGTSFIDVGMGIHETNGELLGILRVTTSIADYSSHLSKRVPLSDSHDDEYSTNIQIAELNALNASLAVIKWKKISGFYQDLTREHNTTYTLNTGQLIHEDIA